MTSAIGRLVVDVQTNKSGGSVAYGDVVINDATTAHSFTTTTSGAFTAGAVGVCIEPNGIASNATGRIQYQGYCAQVNTNASVTLGYFLKTHTVAKQAAGSATRVVGSFGVAMSTATNPAALLWGLPDASSATGNVATDAIWDAKGDLVGGTGADTAARLAVGADDTMLMADAAATTGLKWVAAGTPSTQAPGDTAVVGTADTFTRGDHKHAIPAFTTSTNQLSGNVTATTQNTYYDGPTLTLAAGTWILIGNIMLDGATNATYATAKLWDGTTVVSSAQTIVFVNTSNLRYNNIALTGIVTPSGSTTYKISAAFNANTCTILAAAPTNGAGNNASTLVAIKIG